MTDTKKKPALFSDERTDAERFNPALHRGALDPSRIPGYSEIVQANDIDQADDLWFREQNNGLTKEDVYKQIGAQPQELPVEFAWLPISGTAGAPSANQARVLDRYVNAEGFRLATDEDLTRHGYGFPPSARVAEDGTIRRGSDTALYVRSGEVARMWERFKFEEQAKLSDPVETEFSSGGYAVEATSGEEFDKETVTVKH